MKKTTLCLFLTIVISKIYAQSPQIMLELNVEGQNTKIRDGLSVKILSEKDTIVLTTSEQGFYIPDSLCKKRKTISLKINEFELIFDNIPLTWNSLLPKWEISIDFRPFLKENKWLIRKQKKRVKWFYSLSNGTGSLLTVHKFKKFKPTR